MYKKMITVLCAVCFIVSLCIVVNVSCHENTIPQPTVEEVIIIYPIGQTAVKLGDNIRVLAKITGSVSRAFCKADTIGCNDYEGMWDDGNHDDGSKGDSWYGSNILKVKVVYTGKIPITVKAVNIQGQWGWKTVNLWSDNTLPSISNVTIHYPNNKSSAEDSEFIHITAKVSDKGIVNGIAKVTVDTTAIGGDSALAMNDKGISPDVVANDGIWTSNLVMVSTKNVTGKFGVRINALDIAYNLKSQTGNVVIENPAPILAITQPNYGDYVKGDVRIKIKSESTISDDLLVEYRIDISHWRKMEGKPPIWSTTWNSREVGDGWHTITVRSTDPAGHVSQKSIKIVVDNNPPEISWHSIPKNGAHVNGIIPVSVHAKDFVGIREVTLAIDGRTLPIFKNLSSGFYEYSLQTLELVSGKTYTLTATATDYLDNIAEISSKIFVDNVAPKISLTLKEGSLSETQSDDVIFCIEISDSSEIDKVFIRIDKSKWIQVNKTASGYEYKWITTHADNGKHTIEVKAMDVLGNEGFVEYELSIENDDYSWLSFVIVIIVFIAFVVVFALVGRKKRREVIVSAQTQIPQQVAIPRPIPIKQQEVRK
jgi:predicted secreted protein